MYLLRYMKFLTLKSVQFCSFLAPVKMTLSSKVFGTNYFGIAENFIFSNQSMCKHNSTIPVKILFAIMFMIFETIGNFLLYCMISYEKYGMDSQKRTVTNQLLSSVCVSRILHNFIVIPITTIQHINGDVFSKNIEINSYCCLFKQPP